MLLLKCLVSLYAFTHLNEVRKFKSVTYTVRTCTIQRAACLNTIPFVPSLCPKSQLPKLVWRAWEDTLNSIQLHSEERPGGQRVNICYKKPTGLLDLNCRMWLLYVSTLDWAVSHYAWHYCATKYRVESQIHKKNNAPGFSHYRNMLWKPEHMRNKYFKHPES